MLRIFWMQRYTWYLRKKSKINKAWNVRKKSLISSEEMNEQTWWAWYQHEGTTSLCASHCADIWAALASLRRIVSVFSVADMSNCCISLCSLLMLASSWLVGILDSSLVASDWMLSNDSPSCKALTRLFGSYCERPWRFASSDWYRLKQ